VTMATPPFGKIFGVMSGLSLGIRASNLKSVALTVLELLTFNSHDRPLRTHTHTHTQTDRQTDKHKRTHYLRHSLRSPGDLAEIIMSHTIYTVNTYGAVVPATDAATDRCNRFSDRLQRLYSICNCEPNTTTDVA